MSTVQWVDLSQVALAQVRASVAAVAEAIPTGHRLPYVMEARWRAAQAGEFPAGALSLLRDEDGWAGWAGWCPYLEMPHGWQSTTYFAARLRGSGLLTEARCRQAHARDAVNAWHTERGGSQVTFVSSIRQDNARSLAASRRYARDHGWSDTGRLQFETVANRMAWVLTWTDSDRHTCTRIPATAAG